MKISKTFKMMRFHYGTFKFDLFCLFFLDCRIENVYTTTFFIDSVNIAHK
jgi:hypothetical protein